jgi:hypothetical protein
MAQRIRGQEATVQVVVNGDLKGGSFARVTDFNLTPRTEVVEADFLGQVETDIELQHNGFDFDFSIQEEDKLARDYLFQIVASEKNRTRPPVVNVVVTFAYRDGNASQTIVLQSCTMKLDSLSVGGRKDYVVNKFSGKCKVVTPL